MLNAKATCPRCDSSMARNGATPAGKPRYRCRPCGYSTTNPETTERGQAGDPRSNGKKLPMQVFNRKIRKAKRYVITAAQNATDVHPGFNALVRYCKANKAELIVIPLRYKNSDSMDDASRTGMPVWDDAVMPYMLNTRVTLGATLDVLADAQPTITQKYALTRYANVTYRNSLILGHTKVQLAVANTCDSGAPKLMATTGAITLPNYQRKHNDAHHVQGAAVVEIAKDGGHTIRQINLCDDGSFIDMDVEYSPDKAPAKAAPALALIMGDTHVGSVSPVVEAATWGKKGLVATLNPAALVWHDLLDAASVSPHETGNFFAKRALQMRGLSSIREEVETAVKYVVKRGAGRNNYIVGSNHDDMLGRWIKREHWANTGADAEFYLHTAMVMVQGMQPDATTFGVPDPFAYWVDQLRDDTVITCIPIDDPLKVANVELGMHGHHGPNGSRGSPKNLSTLGTKAVTGHGHSAAIVDGHYRVGTSTELKLPYTNGPSNWTNTHCVIYANGKRSLLFM